MKFNLKGKKEENSSPSKHSNRIEEEPTDR